VAAAALYGIVHVHGEGPGIAELLQGELQQIRVGDILGGEDEGAGRSSGGRSRWRRRGWGEGLDREEELDPHLVRDAAGRRRAPRGGGAREEDDKSLLRVNDQNLLESNFFMGQKNDGSNYPHPSFYECGELLERAL
jgi:hypothetical protein